MGLDGRDEKEITRARYDCGGG